MNADERTPGQQGYGEQTPQDQSRQDQPRGQQQQQQTGQQQASESQDGSMATGQASYGNSGETGADTLSQNSSSLGQDSDLGQSGQQDHGSKGGLFSGSGDDMGGVGSGQTAGQQGSGDQDFADQGQGAMNEDLIGSDEDSGTTDIEVERSQGRESDIEGSSL